MSAVFLGIANFFDVWVVVCIACILALGVELWAARTRSGRFSFLWKRDGVWASVVVLGLFMMIFGSFINKVLPSRIQVANVDVRPSWQGTMQVGGAALNQPTSLIFGVGPNTFGREWGLYKPASVNQTVFWNTDFNAGIGSIPTSFVTTGILGILAWIIFVAIVLWIAARALIKRAQDVADVGNAAAFGLGTGYLIAFYIFYVPGPALSMLVFLTIGLLVAFSVHARLTKPFYLSLRRDAWQGIAASAALALFCLVIVLALLGVSRVLVAEILLNRSVVVYNATKDTRAASALITDALLINPSNTRAHRIAVQLGLVELQQLISRADPTNEMVRAQLQTTLQATIQHGLDAVAINGNDYQNWLELAGLYQQLAGVQVAGAYESARGAYQRARLQNPSSPLPLFQLARLELLENHKEEALKDLAAAAQLKPDFAAAYYLASQIYGSNGDLKNAHSSASLAVQYAPQDPLAWYNIGSIAYAEKDYVTAIPALEKALALEPNYANAEYVLGLSYFEAGRPQDSLRVFEALAALEPNRQVVQDAITNLRENKPPIPVPAPAK